MPQGQKQSGKSYYYKGRRYAPPRPREPLPPAFWIALTIILGAFIGMVIGMDKSISDLKQRSAPPKEIESQRGLFIIIGIVFFVVSLFILMGSVI